MPTERAARRLLVRTLKRAGIENAALDVRWLTEVDTKGLDPDTPLTPETWSRLQALINRRIAGEPTWRIIGEREFWGLTFQLSPATLEPRPDSETIVEAALAAIENRQDDPLAILDLGTGTGCLLIAMLHECTHAVGLGIDLSEEACRTASENAERNGVSARARFRQGHWADGVDERFDLILSNPPYIPSAEIETLTPEVRDHDPRLALDGGQDGLAPYRAFACSLPARLNPGGVVILEIGAGQKDDVVALMREGGLELRSSRCDLGGHERALIFASQ